MVSAVRTLAAGAVSDAIFSADGSKIYVSKGGDVIAYDIASGLADGSWTFGGTVGGLDLTPDGTHLLATQRVAAPSGMFSVFVSVYDINLTTNDTSTFTGNTDSFGTPSGLFDIVATSNATALVNSSIDSYGSIFNVDLITNTFTAAHYQQFGPAALISSSDHSTIVLSNNRYALVYSPSGNSTASIGGIISSTAINASGDRIAAIYSTDFVYGPTAQYRALNIYDRNLQLVTAVSPILGDKLGPAGQNFLTSLTYNADGSKLYVTSSFTGLLYELQTTDWSITGTFVTGISASDQISASFGNGLKLSADGHTMSIITANKLLLVDLTQAAAIAGDNGNNVLTGSADIDALIGHDGNDILDGGAGADTMIGGAGDDIYHVDNSGDRVIELDNGGNDTIITSLDWTASANIEILQLADGANANLSANGAGTRIVGNALGTTFNGQAGNDTILAGGGSDLISGADGNDALYGQDGDDFLYGGAGNDLLDGGTGLDRMEGGFGNDSYGVDNGGDVVVELANGGTDIVTTTVNYVIPDNVEILQFGVGSSGTLTGNSAANQLIGSLGDDVLIGGGGADQLIGGAGNDRAVLVGNRAAYLVGFAPNGDALLTATDGQTRLSGIESIQFADQVVAIADLAIRGTEDADTLNGTPQADTILGLGGADLILAGAGDDLLIGGPGDDVLNGGDGDDTVAIDAVRSATRFQVSAGGELQIVSADGIDTLRSIENVRFLDQIASVASMVLMGSAAGESLTATANGMTVLGLGGDDQLRPGQFGGPGFNGTILDGGAGNDTYFVSTPDTIIREAADGGNDSVNFTFDYSLLSGTAALGNNLEFLGVSQTITRNMTLIGNELNNFITGAMGNDTIIGGAGADVMLGGGGIDTFLDTRANFNGDTINGLEAGDRIVFSDATLTNFAFNLAGSTLTYTGGSMTLTNAISGQISGRVEASAIAGGGVALTIVTKSIDNDFNGDGRADILWRNDGGQTGYWRGQGGGIFTPNPTLYNVANDWKIVGTGDFNGDGRTDLLWRNDNGTFGDWFGDTEGTFRVNARLYDVTNDWKIAGTGDFNGDGQTDILWRNVVTGQTGDWVATNDYTGNFTALPTLYGVSADWKIAGTGDFNGDGRDDILWRNDNGMVGDWFGRPDGTFTPNATLASAPTDWKIAGTGDFNGDGRDDILWRNVVTGETGTWSATAQGNFIANAAIYGVSSDWRIVDTGDYNGDGRTDILWRNNDGQTGDWLGNADGSFTANGTIYSVTNDWRIQSDNILI